MLGLLLLGGLRFQVLLDLDVPLLVGGRGVDLDLETVGHVRSHVGDVDLELLVPPAHLVDRAVFLDEQRIVDACLVLPDLDVL